MQQSSNTSNLKTAEKELEMALAHYKTEFLSYSHNKNTGFSKKAKDNLQQMRTLNNHILKLIKNLEEHYYVKSYTYKKDHKADVEFTNMQLIAMAETLQKDDKEIKKMLYKLQDIDGVRDDSELQASVSYYHYIYYIISFVIIIFLLLRAFSSDDSNGVETVILVLAILLLVFHFGGRIINNSQNFIYAHNLI